VPDDSKLERCIRLLGAAEERGEIATRDVMALLGTDRQTAMRDLRSLRAAGVPLVPVGHGAGRRYRLDPAWRRAHGRLSAWDQLALHVGRQRLEALGFRPPADESSLERRVVCVGGPHEMRGSEEVIGPVLRGISEDRELRIVTLARTWDRLQPLALVIRDKELVLVAQEPNPTGYLRVALDAVREIRCLEGRFRFPRKFDLPSALASPDPG
jgi:hypothetical protein